jgi:protein-tyrosine phosphatase
MGNYISYSYPYYVKSRSLIEYYFPLANNQDLHEVYPNIFVGNISTSFNKEHLKNKGITHILSVIDGMGKTYPNDFTYMNLKAIDNKECNLSQYFENSYQFINDAIRKGGKVYVHCICGVSRSVSVVIAYLIKEKKMSPEKALMSIKTIRPVANPNQGFREQLKLYAKECKQELESNFNFDDPEIINKFLESVHQSIIYK